MECKSHNLSTTLGRKEIRAELENPSLREFVKENKQYLKGKVLDFGAGEQPYKNLIIGEYIPYDKSYAIDFPKGKFDAILCTQVLEYLENPKKTIKGFRQKLKEGGYLVMTYPTCWEEVEDTDKLRITKAGMEYFLKKANFEIIKHELRAKIQFKDFYWAIGYGVVCRKPQDIGRSHSVEEAGEYTYNS